MERAARARGKGSRIRRWETVQFEQSASGLGKNFWDPPQLTHHPREIMYNTCFEAVFFREAKLPRSGVTVVSQ